MSDDGASSPMRPLCRDSYAKPCRWHWAGQRFVKPGLYLWIGNKNRRVLWWPKLRNKGGV